MLRSLFPCFICRDNKMSYNVASEVLWCALWQCFTLEPCINRYSVHRGSHIPADGGSVHVHLVRTVERPCRLRHSRLFLAALFQSPSARASWTSCARTASSVSSTPWCVTGSSSAVMAPTRTPLSPDAVSGWVGRSAAPWDPEDSCVPAFSLWLFLFSRMH